MSALHTKTNQSFLAGSWFPDGEWAGSIFTTDTASSKRQGYVDTISRAHCFPFARDGSVGRATRQGLDGYGSIPGRDNTFFSSSERPDGSPHGGYVGCCPGKATQSLQLTTHPDLVTRLRKLSPCRHVVMMPDT
jgi:hypothetical protein